MFPGLRLVDTARMIEPARTAVPLAPRRTRWLWWLLAYASLLLGLIGVVLPGLPTVPFVLLSAFAAARGSQRLHAWLLAHRQFGPMIRDWQAEGAVSRRAKWLATTMMGACAAIMFLTAPKWWMAATGTTIMAIVATWLWFRPEPGQGRVPDAMQHDGQDGERDREPG